MKQTLHLREPMCIISESCYCGKRCGFSDFRDII